MRLVLAAMTATTFVVSAQSVDEILQKARAYVERYEAAISTLVAEEHYIQEVREKVASGGGNLSRDNPGGGFSAPPRRGMRRVLRSDYLLARLPDGGGWMPFRDVFEVDGRKVRDREDRLVALFLKPTDSSFDQAARIMHDSTRYNLGGVQRTINIPTLALMLLDHELASRFVFTPGAQEDVAGRHAAVVDYREVARPTLIKTSLGGDVPLTGRFWIDPATGIVLKTQLTAEQPRVRAEVRVTFREDAKLPVWVPAVMEEFYVQDGEDGEITARAEYSKHRRFSVTTEEAIKKPPEGIRD